MKTITEDLGFLNYFPSIKILCRYIQSLEDDVASLKDENSELKIELRREREAGREDIERIVTSFTTSPEIKPSAPSYWERQENESPEDYNKRLKTLQPKSSSFRNHNDILDDALNEHVKILDKKREDVEREIKNTRSGFVIGDSKRTELINKAREIVEKANG